MSDFKTSIDPSSQDPYHRIQVDPIGQKHEEGRQQEQEQRKKRSVFASVLSFISDRLINFFPKRTSVESLLLMEKDLEHIKKCFNELKENDLSQDIHFLQQLSDYWLLFLADFDPISYSKHPMITKIHQFLSTVEAFPIGQQYSLGYYLSESAGLRWIPFPYMAILKNLYQDHQVNQENSQLQAWTNEIDAMIAIEEE